MKIKKIFLIQILLIVFMFFSSFIQETFFVNKNVSLPIKEVEQVCSTNGNYCVSSIDCTNLDKNLNVDIIIDLYQYQIIFNIVYFLLFLFSVFAFISFIKNRNKEKFENSSIEENKFPFGVLFLFSLFPIYKILYLYSNNITEVPFSFILTIILIFSGLFFLFYIVVSKYLLKNKLEAVFASLFIMIFLANIKIFLVYNSNLLFWFCILLSFISFLLILKLEKITFFIKPFFLSLMLLCFLNGVYNLGQFYFSKMFKKEEVQKVEIDNNAGFNNKLTRDVFIIVLDMYPAKETTDSLGYDNSAFIAQLEERGFFVFENIKSNYNKTGTSISSMLNFDYVGNLQYENVNDAVHNAKLFQLFKKNNYTIYYLNSWPTIFNIKRNNYIDYCINNTSQNNKYLQETLLSGNVLSYFFDILFDNPKLNLGLNYIDKIIEDKTEKKVSFLHLLMPHWPYLYDENGRKLEETYDKIVSKSHSRLNKKSFLSFLQYTNKITIEYIDKILSTKKEKPIIIITGDHGIREDYYHSNEEKLFEELEKNKDFMKKHFNTVLAYYNPEMNKESYKEVKSLVNFFRMFSNELFELDNNILQDKYFYILYSNSGANFSVTENREIKDIL